MSKERQLQVTEAIPLRNLQLPSQLKELNNAQCNALCSEIREILMQTVTKTGGHLASNLGVVELTLALHRQFDSPNDRIVWDVGHQTYVHKLLTGRYERFATLRQENGISGFPKPSESPHDAFVTGHSGTAVSAACGIADAMRINGSKHYAVAVVGDGAATGGMFYEGLNNGGKSRNNLIVILNDNNCAISKNVGAVAKYLSSIRHSTEYVRTKWAVERTLDRTPVVGKPIAGVLKKTKDAIRKNVIKNSTLFDNMGFVYLGPVDGHDIEALDEALEVAKSYHRPVLVHVNTVKGKGYAPAEQNPGEYHGVPKIEVLSKNPEISTDECYSTVFGRELATLAASDRRICAVTAAMKYGTGLQFFSAMHRDRFFDVGIAEEHAVTFCAGLASMNMIPVFAVYSTFLQRGYDQILHDIAIAGYHVVFAIDRAGVVGEDGETHQGLFDVTMLTAIPNIKIYSPATYAALRCALKIALHEDQGPVCIRYPRGTEPTGLTELNDRAELTHLPSEGARILLISYGRLSAELLQARNSLKERGIVCDVLHMNTIFPIPAKAIAIAAGYETVYFFEEGIREGGIGEKFAAALLQSGYQGNYRCRAVDGFVRHASVKRCLALQGLTADAITDFVTEDPAHGNAL